MDEHPNATLVRKGFAAFAAGDIASLAGVLADNVVWHVGGKNVLAGDHRGRTQVLDLFGRIRDESERFAVDVHDILANDEHVVVLARVVVTRQGTTVYEGAVYVFHVAAGRVTECWVTNGDQYATDRVWAA